MKDKIRQVFDNNIELIEKVDKAVYYFREEVYDRALFYVVDSIDNINRLVKAFLEEEAYFSQVEENSVLSMIENILFAKKSKDYVLLADLLELQLSSFLCEIQELIIEKEEFPYSVETYQTNLPYIEAIDSSLFERLREPEDARKLLEKGYAVEYSSCGLMTLAALEGGSKFYFHTNNHVMQEAFLLARKWTKKKAQEYHVYGLGLAYHIKELMELAPTAQIYVYESDFHVLRLALNFIDMSGIFCSENVTFVFDETLEKIREITEHRPKGAFVALHYPSYRNAKGDKFFLKPFISGWDMLEE